MVGTIYVFLRFSAGDPGEISGKIREIEHILQSICVVYDYIDSYIVVSRV